MLPYVNAVNALQTSDRHLHLFAEEPGCTHRFHKSTNICNDKLAGGKKRQGFSFRQNIEKNYMRRNRDENDQGGTAKRGRSGKIFVNWDFQATFTVNTWKISGMLIVWWPITIMFRTPEQTSKPQTNYRCCLQFGCLMPYWLFPLNTITFHKYFWCSRFCEFHSKIRQESNNKNRQLGKQA